MNKAKTQVVQKLNVIVELVRHCAVEVVSTNDPILIQETTLAAVTHESLCRLFEESGPSEEVVGLVNDFGRAIADLYKKIKDFEHSFNENAKTNNLLN